VAMHRHSLPGPAIRARNSAYPFACHPATAPAAVPQRQLRADLRLHRIWRPLAEPYAVR
jgi:hypothetical protein